MTTLILGGTGFIGARIAHRLVEGSEQVVSLDVIPDAASVARLRGRVTLLQGDVARIDDILSAIRRYRADRIIDMAYILNSESDQEAHTAIRVNALGVSNAFEAARLLDVERVLYASSIAVYGDQSLYGERPVSEQDMPAPSSLYGAAKLLNEYEAALYRQSYGLSFIGVRIGVVFGHGRLRGQGLWAARFASDPAVGKPAVLPLVGDTRAALIHVDDVAELFARILMAPSPLHAVYNTGGDDASLDELASEVRRLIPDAQYTFGTGRLNLPYSIDAARAESEFDWRRCPLPERIADHIAVAREAQRHSFRTV